MAGIYGNPRDGTFSVVLSNAYKDDEDGGDVMYVFFQDANLYLTISSIYTGSGGRERFSNASPPKRVCYRNVGVNLLRANITHVLLAPSRSTDHGSDLGELFQQSLAGGEADPLIPSSRSSSLSRYHSLLENLYE